MATQTKSQPQLTKTGQSDSAADSEPLRRPKNELLRSREYLLPDEVDKLLGAAKKMGRYGQRNATLLLMMYRHGLRVSEAIALRWNQVDLKEGQLHVRRLKNGKPSVQRLAGTELRSLRQLQRDFPDSPHLFVSERGGPLTDHAVRKLVSRVGEAAGFDFPVHPHMFRHATGYYLASKGHDTRAIQDYLGHRNIHHTVRYTELAPGRFDDFWTD
ncbi:MAG: tyrosine-type recombinase/integrase [Acaryochloridaceae cyanobacterium CSU_3_4]|nr:tyrosine-type recombinase/integrase [Acaryochloridaceae cyanobacterium CSU_3_4]